MINIKETEAQKIWVTSDPHLGHNPNWVSNPAPWQSRGFKDVKEHDDMWIELTNELVRPNDYLLMLGDFCLNTSVAQFNAYLDRIQCRNILSLWGNHNNPHEKAIYRAAMGNKFVGPFPVETYPLQYKNMLYMGYYLEAVLNGQYTVLQHYPLYVWSEMAHGAWMLCGHSHNGCELSRAETTTGKILDVGWDGHGKPWSLEEIRAVMDKKQIVAVDHHHPDKTQIPNPQTKL